MQSESLVDKAILPVQPSGAGAMPPISLDPPQRSSLQPPESEFETNSLLGPLMESRRHILATVFVCPSVRPSVRPSTDLFSDENFSWD